MAGSKPYSLGRSERLKSRKQIDLLFRMGKKLTQFPIRLLYRKETGPREIRAGFTVSSKIFPRAVDRNRIKRLCREGYRLGKKELEPVMGRNENILHLFFVYTAGEILSQEEIAVSIKRIIEKLIRRIHEEDAANT